MKKVIFIFGLLLCCSLISLYGISLSDLRIIASDGTFLGTLNENEYDSNSIYNKYGKYGSQYNAFCIFNKYGNYGSDYSDKSPFNKYANNAPGLYDKQGNFYGTLSINSYAKGVTQQTYQLALQLKAYRDSF
ncbi:hypothetical protein [Treponema sp. R80B11-R83G3]